MGIHYFIKSEYFNLSQDIMDIFYFNKLRYLGYLNYLDICAWSVIITDLNYG